MTVGNEILWGVMSIDNRTVWEAISIGSGSVLFAVSVGNCTLWSQLQSDLRIGVVDKKAEDHSCNWK